MQLLCNLSSEIKLTKGLEIIDSKVEKLTKIKNLPLPHIGFNKIDYNQESKLLKSINKETFFYFNHMYAIKNIKNGIKVFSEYGQKFVSLYENKNIFATQFHPEKSQLPGLKLIHNFINL